MGAIRQRNVCIKHCMPHVLYTLVPFAKEPCELVLHAQHACV